MLENKQTNWLLFLETLFLFCFDQTMANYESMENWHFCYIFLILIYYDNMWCVFRVLCSMLSVVGDVLCAMYDVLYVI